MPIEHKLTRCEATDPHRCQATGQHGQCPYLAIPDFSFCQRHVGVSVAADAKRRSNQYRLQIWQKRLDEFAESDNVKSLRDEIGILRILMEEILNKCTDSNQLLIYSSKISDLAIKIEKLVTSCHRLEARMGMLLDKSAALSLAGQIVDIIGQHVSDPDTIDSISSGIISALATLGGVKEDGNSQ